MTPLVVSLLPEHLQTDAYHLHCHSHLNPWQQSSFLDCLTPPYFALALQDDGQLVGYALLLLVLDEATLMDIAIAPERRGQRAGSLLLQETIKACREKGAQTLWLEVRASNAPAIALYAGHGFMLVERRKAYYTTEGGREDALIMRCLLGQEETTKQETRQ